MKLTVRDFRSISQMDNGETYFDLPVIFEGTLADCHSFCEKEKGYSWKTDSQLLFGGYYVQDGKCLMIV